MYNFKFISIQLIIIFIFTNITFSVTISKKNPVLLNIKSLPNSFKVSDKIYRGAQPVKDGFLELKNLGIKTIINLRKEDYDTGYINDLSIKYFHLPINSFNPDKKIYQKYLDIIKDESNYPIFVHCQFGSDRTGVAIVLYRIYIESWSVDDAINEMVNGGFGFHKIYGNLINFVKKFDYK